MSDYAAIQAQIVDIRSDDRHKGFIKVTLHVPAECGQQLTAAMGWPTYTTPVPVAIARLNPDNVKEVMPPESRHSEPGLSPSETPPASGPDIQARARKPVDPDKRMAQRAGILCNDPLFQRYLAEKHNVSYGTSSALDNHVAANFIRQFCQVDTRADIKPNTEAALRWQLLESAFVAWRDVPEYADAS